MFLYKLRGIKFRSSFNGKVKLCTLAFRWYLVRLNVYRLNVYILHKLKQIIGKSDCRIIIISKTKMLLSTF